MRKIQGLLRSREKGFSLIEVVIAILLLSILSLAILQTARVTSTVSIGVDNKRNALNLAELQMDYVKNLSYAGSYSAVTPEASRFPGYSVTTEVRPIGIDSNNNGIIDSIEFARDTNIQLIIITVSYGAKTLITLEGYKTQ